MRRKIHDCAICCFIHPFIIYFFFFFQAEDGIRDHCVTGVQTCALPIALLQREMVSINGGGAATARIGQYKRQGAATTRNGQIGRASWRERV